MKGRSFLKLLDYTPEEIVQLLDLAAELKFKKQLNMPHDELKGKNIALIFEKTSTRTRCSFEVAAHDLGMHVTYLDPSGSQIGKKESIADTARVLGRIYDGIEYRGYGQEIVETLAKYAGVPVWNGLTNEFHPTQILADFLTLRERFAQPEGTEAGVHGRRALQHGQFADGRLRKAGHALRGVRAGKVFSGSRAGQEPAAPSPRKPGGTIAFSTDPGEAVKGANAIYTDVWVSMGEPDAVWAERIHDLTPYRVDSDLMRAAGPGCVFMHCLPAFHDLNTTIGREIHAKYGITEMEVTDEVFESPASIVFEEAENRMHTIKAVMYATLK